MEKYLILAKKIIVKFIKSRKYRLLLLVFVAKLLLSLIGLIFISYFVINANQVDAAYDLSTDIKQVKTADNTTVYYLDHNRGMKKAYVNAQAFLAYGNKWSDIKIISQEDLNKWPEIKLVKSQTSPTVYFISNNQKALIKSEQQFIDAGFKWSEIVTINQVDLDEYKTIEFKVIDAGIDTGDDEVMITLDPASPKPGYLAVNTQDNLVAIFDLQTNNSLIEIKSLILNLNGIFESQVIDEIYLTNESDQIYQASFSLAGRQARFNFNSRPLVIRAGELHKIKVLVDFNNQLNSVNHTFQVALNGVDSIVGAKARGLFPVAGEIFQLISAGNYLGQVSASENSLNIKNNEAVIGSAEEIIGKFSLSETSKMSDVLLKELIFINAGSASSGDISDFKLRNKNNNIVASIKEMTKDGKIIFRLENCKISKGTSEIFTILADINGGNNGTINLQLNKVRIKSASGNYNLVVSITNIDENIIIKRKLICVIAKDLASSKNIFSQQTGVIIGVFEIRNNKQKISLERLGLSLEKSASAPNLSETVYLVNYSTGEIYAYFSGSEFSKDLINVNLNGLDLSAKDSLTFTLLADIDSSAKNGDSYRIILNTIDYRSASNGRFSDNVNTQGVKLVVNKSVIYLFPNNELGELKYTKGEKKVKIASFILEAASGSDSKITGLTVALADSSGAITFANGFSNVKAYVSSNLGGTTRQPVSNNLTFNNFNYKLKAGSRIEVKIYADTERDLKVSETQLKLVNLVATSQNSAIPAVINNLGISSHKVVFGEAKAEISKVINGFVVKDKEDNVAASFKIKNTGAEDLKLKSLVINTVNSDLSYSLGYSNLKIVDRARQKKVGSTISKPVAGANKISLGSYIIKAGEEITFDVHVKTDASVTDKEIEIYFSELVAAGKTSKVLAQVTGDPTTSYNLILHCNFTF